MTLKNDLCRKFLTNAFMRERKSFSIIYSDRNALIMKTCENQLSIWKMLKEALMLMNNDSEAKRRLIVYLSWNNKKENDLFRCWL